ncbi:MAG: AEC family transporter [Gammaproteobacteria bacterium]|nr:AEC family transporter [Gammaproteobacteria bacterium]
MALVLAQAGILIIIGILWRRWSPHGLEGELTRRVVTGVVYHLLLPALVLAVMWRTPLGWDALRLVGAALSGCLVAIAIAFLWYRRCKDRATCGAMILAASFANVTYLGLPVLEKTFGPWARSVAIQYDVLVNTPLLFTLGIIIAQRYGQRHPDERNGIANLLRVPALWATLLALMLNLTNVPQPTWIEDFLETLGHAVPPLMLFALGLSLQWPKNAARKLVMIVPALVIQLFIMPLTVAAVGLALDLPVQVWMATVLEAAMPTMVLGIAVCDRYGLNTALFAVTVTLSTALSALTLPLWFAGLRNFAGM